MSRSLPSLAPAVLLALLCPAPAPGDELPLKQIPLGRAEKDWNKSPSWLAFSPDGRYLAVRYPVSDDKDVIRLWDAVKLKEQLRWDVEGTVGSLPFGRGQPCAFTPDGEGILYVASDGVRLRRLPEGGRQGEDRQLTTEIPPRNPIGGFYGLAVWPVGGEAGRFLLTYHQEGQVVLQQHLPRNQRAQDSWRATSRDSSARAVAVDAAGKRLAVGIYDVPTSGQDRREIDLWDITAKKRLATLPGHESTVSALAFSPDGKLLTSGSMDGSVKLWDTATGKEVAVFKGPSYTVTRLVFAPDGKRLFYTTHDRKGSPNLWLIDVERRKVLAAVAVDNRGLGLVSVSPKGDRLATHGSDDVIRVWDVDWLIKHGK